MQLDAIYFETQSYFVFIENEFIFVKLLLQKDNKIVAISHMNKLKNPDFSSLSQKISHYIGSRVSAIILMDNFHSLWKISSHMTRMQEGL